MSKKVLIVDDEEQIVNLVKFVMERNKWETVFCTNGVEAINKIRQEIFDCIILDINMPGINGMDVLRVLKSDQQTKEIKIIILTGFHNEEDEKIVKELGGDAYLAKPFTISTITDKIKELFQDAEDTIIDS